MKGKKAVLIINQVFLFLGLSLGWVEPTGAETWKARELRLAAERAAWRFGPLKLQPAILIKDAGYDSNIYYQPDAVSDYWLTAGPAFDAYLVARRRLIVHVFESPQYVFFFKTKRERTWNNYLNGDVSLSFNRFLLTVGGSLNNARERWSTELDIRPRRKEKSGFVSLLYQKSYRLSFEFTARTVDYTYESLEYDSVNINERLSHYEDYLSGRIYYRLNPRIQFFIEGQKGSYDFKDPLNRGDSSSQTIYSGFQFSPTGRIHGQIRLGYKSFETLEAELPDYQGLVGDTTVSWQIMRPVVLRGSYRRDINFSVWSYSPYYIGTTWSAGPSFYIFRKKFRLDYTFSQTRNKYPLGEAPDSPPRLDRYTLNSVAVYYRIGKTAGIGVTAGSWRREVNVLNWDADRKFIGLNLTYDF
ncbi:MAG TPA: outer membrane beta-barrel protein [Candidatus Saccharicenans sp.]|nr:outer membrane beta-barrel protein [Candidatus Saccharicenans sp.]HOL45287.1 outer membrane beta-barrel protein [Candidatus Saccharicenans sp.]HOM94047.1 outer membrane beta-barrel protein [Candidatus Saccharicenans sp.]HOT68977.1 outer membrane beta-barrel protein [Candidatus Saccharicenans sp.]HPC87967.1 outer membrane beta-barrel protein [Candidatus Saccharicenans sp.]